MTVENSTVASNQLLERIKNESLILEELVEKATECYTLVKQLRFIHEHAREIHTDSFSDAMNYFSVLLDGMSELVEAEQINIKRKKVKNHDYSTRNHSDSASDYRRIRTAGMAGNEYITAARGSRRRGR